LHQAVDVGRQIPELRARGFACIGLHGADAGDQTLVDGRPGVLAECMRPAQRLRAEIVVAGLEATDGLAALAVTASAIELLPDELAAGGGLRVWGGRGRKGQRRGGMREVLRSEALDLADQAGNVLVV